MNFQENDWKEKRDSPSDGEVPSFAGEWDKEFVRGGAKRRKGEGWRWGGLECRAGEG